MLIKVYIYSDIYNHKRSIKFSTHSDVNKGMLWWQKCILVHIVMTFANILILQWSVGLVVMSQLNVELLHLVFDIPTRLIDSITLECNNAVTIYVHYLHQFQHI